MAITYTETKRWAKESGEVHMLISIAAATSASDTITIAGFTTVRVIGTVLNEAADSDGNQCAIGTSVATNVITVDLRDGDGSAASPVISYSLLLDCET